jgi:exodeoxyribonuclease VII small subunit
MSDEERADGDFESRMRRLEEIVHQLEEGELNLERSLALFEEGIALARRLETQLGDAEMKVEQLLQRADGSEETAPLDAESIADETEEGL